MRKLFNVILTVFAASGVSGVALAAEPIPFKEVDKCTTKSTGGDGVRHTCDFEVCYAAPAGNYVKPDSITVQETNGAGSTHYCSAHYFTEYDKFLVTLPNGLEGEVQVPIKVCAKGHAKGPGGHFSGRGWVECTLGGIVVPYE